MRKKILFIFIPIFLIFAFKISAALYPNSSKTINILSEIINIIRTQYVSEISDTKIIEGALSGILTNLDPHSDFLNQKEYEELKANAKGEFGGLGIEIIIDNGLRIITPIDDTPAFYAGIKAGDVIIAVDDESVAKMTPTEAISKIKGAKGTKVKITILRQGESQPLEFKLTRDIIKLKTVKWHLYDKIAYIRISSFAGNTDNDVKKAILTMIKESTNKLEGFIIDLRNNPGGMLDQSIYVSQLFLDDGVIVSTQGRNKKDNHIYSANNLNLSDNIPIVVLINGGSASASEIVAGALQDHKRAVIMGMKSFGKASVQSIIPLNNLGALRMTTAYYYTPSGKLIQKEGIIPDIIVEESQLEATKEEKKKITPLDLSKDEIWKTLYERDLLLQKAINFLKNSDSFGIKR